MGALWSGQKQADISGSVTEPSETQQKEYVSHLDLRSLKNLLGCTLYKWKYCLGLHLKEMKMCHAENEGLHQTTLKNWSHGIAQNFLVNNWDSRIKIWMLTKQVPQYFGHYWMFVYSADETFLSSTMVCWQSSQLHQRHILPCLCRSINRARQLSVEAIWLTQSWGSAQESAWLIKKAWAVKWNQ